MAEANQMDEKTNNLWIEIFIGLPASGKTTYFRQTYQSNPSVVRVSRDDFRNMRGKYWLPKDEDLITDWEIVTAGIALLKGKNVVIDATNLDPQRRANLIASIDDFITASGNEFPISIRYRDFTGIPVKECIERDNLRADKVGKRVIVHMAMKYGLYEHPYPEYRREEAGLPMAIICDLDGTLALNRTNRDVYAVDERVMEDDLNRPVAEVLFSFKRLFDKIIIFSGRSEASRLYTETWLQNHNIKYDLLVMRPIGDNRSDEIVKKEMFDKHIEGKYNIRFIMDDRDRVVKMWRDNNLPTFQVNYGDF